jgi:hypothetical protein
VAGEKVALIMNAWHVVDKIRCCRPHGADAFAIGTLSPTTTIYKNPSALSSTNSI